MFTGIVEAKGTVAAAGGGMLEISAPGLTELLVGGSVSVNGACLSVTGLSEGGFRVDVVPETMRRTNLGRLSEGSAVNLERPVPAAGRLDGHIVQGHVDGTARITGIRPDGTSRLLEMEMSPDLARYVVEKGFVAVDGVSLTIVDCGENWFSVAIIPITAAATTLGERRIGEDVNIEVDVLAKYVERLLAVRP